MTMTVKPKQARRFAINVRIPGWARNEPVPSALYRFIDDAGAGRDRDASIGTRSRATRRSTRAT